MLFRSRPKPPTRFAQAGPPVDTEHPRAARGHLIEEMGGSVDIENRRGSQVGDRSKNRLLVRQRKAPIVFPAQQARPGIKKLDGIGSGLQLGAQLASGSPCQGGQQGMQQLRILVHQALDPFPASAEIPLH